MPVCKVHPAAARWLSRVACSGVGGGNKALHNRVTLSGLWAVLQLEIRGKETDSIYWDRWTEQVLQMTNIGAMRSRSVCVCVRIDILCVLYL